MIKFSTYKHLFEKGYTPSWTTEIFTIRKRQPSYPATYHLKDYTNNPIDGGFYEFELQKTNYPKSYLVEKILKHAKGKLFGKWLGFESNHNSRIN